MYVDSKGYVWIGTNKGLAILDTNNNKIIDITYILDEMGVSDKFIRAVYEDSKGNYYIGCFLEGGLIKINPNTKEYKIYKNIENDDSSISNNSIRYINEDFDQLLSKIESGIINGSISATLEDASDFQSGTARCSVRVFERYSYAGGNRVSLNITLFQNDKDPVQLSAITAGGSQAVFFKINTWGEEAFLDKLIELLDFAN